jgi:hypothetical protein
MFTVILSPTFGTYAPTPNAERLNEVVALKPIDCALVIGCTPCLFKTASKTTGLVTSFTVRLPVILYLFLPKACTLVLLKVMFGYFSASKKSGVFKCSSKAFTLVFKLANGMVTLTDESAGFALSTEIVP